MPPFNASALRTQLLSDHPTTYAEGLASLGAIIRQGLALPAGLIDEVLEARCGDAAGRSALLGSLRHAPAATAVAITIQSVWQRVLAEDGAPGVRVRAAELLVDAHPGVVPALMDALAGDPAPDVRLAAARSLSQFSLAGELDTLARLFRNERDARVQAGLIHLMACPGDASVLPMLVKALDDPALCGAVLEAVKCHFTFDDLVMPAEPARGESLVGRMRGMIVRGPEAAARRLLERVGQILRSDPDVRHRALATGCLSFHDPAGADVLHALNDEALEVRRVALEVLSTIHCPGASETLMAMYAREKPLRRDILAAMGQQRDASVVHFLARAYESAADDDEARLGAIDGLADLGLCEGLETLATAMDDPSVWNRNAAAAGIWKVLTFIDAAPDDALSARVVRALAGALQDANAQVARHAARALGATAHPDAARHLLVALPGAEDDLAAQILQSLGELRSTEALPHLRAVRPGAPYRVLDSALTALSRFEDDAILPDLIERLSWPAAGLSAREHLIDRIMGFRSPAARNCLVMCLTDEDEFVRERAASALEGFDHQDVVQALVERLRDPCECEDVQVAASRSLSSMRSVGTVRAVMPLLDSPLARVRRGALLTLAGIPGPARLRAIDRALDDEDDSVRDIAIEIAQMLIDDAEDDAERADD